MSASPPEHNPPPTRSSASFPPTGGVFWGLSAQIWVSPLLWVPLGGVPSSKGGLGAVWLLWGGNGDEHQKLARRIKRPVEERELFAAGGLDGLGGAQLGGLSRGLVFCPLAQTWWASAAPNPSSGSGRGGCCCASPRRSPWGGAQASPSAAASPPWPWGTERRPPWPAARSPGTSRSPAFAWLRGDTGAAGGDEGRGPGRGHPALDSLLPVGPVPAEVPGGPELPVCEDSLPVRDRSWFSSLRQLGCLCRGKG